ncbi:MAG: hypothetical protein K1060chlam5_01220, partial [Candidatus Anoxychlamydiales bacterium]|nr:hypothetical protein [Candidatus Anoxychlamydiales bacterium]
ILTFWGTRYIKVVGYQDRAPIDSLAARVIKIVENKKFEYTEQEREKGILISRNINKLYSDSDKQVGNSNILTRIFSAFIGIYHRLLDINSIPGSFKSIIRKRWDDDKFHDSDGFNKVFNFYTKNQYFEKFNSNPDLISTQFWSENIKLAFDYDIISEISDKASAEIKAEQEGPL